uniref:Uncharacterized protein n=1 Tax=viral metagenome TaxID=1070528 RepID=A0A6M3JJC4_9ZZZZ
MTWKELKATKVGTILHDKDEEGLRFIIMRGPASLCAYIGLPLNHPLADQNYNDLPIQAHGGLTFGRVGEDEWPKGYFWFGWDYAHGRDYSFGDDNFLPFQGHHRRWLVDDVIRDSQNTIYNFQQLMRLVERLTKWSQKD